MSSPFGADAPFINLACVLTILTLRKVGTSKVEQNIDGDHVSSNSAVATAEVDTDAAREKARLSADQFIGDK